MLAAVLLIIFLLVVIVGVPISFAMGFMTISAFTIGNGAMVIIPQKMFSGVYNFTYMCIPLFILASEIMSRCGLTMSIVKFCDTLVGHIRGGLAHVNILASMLFAGISGSATADASGLGRIEMEMMTKAGYTKEYSAAVTAASAIIGPIIPPSNIMIIYAVCASNVSVSAMFLGGIMPGIVLGLAEMLLCYYFARKYNHPCRARRSSAREVRPADYHSGRYRERRIYRHRVQCGSSILCVNRSCLQASDYLEESGRVLQEYGENHSERYVDYLHRVSYELRYHRTAYSPGHGRGLHEVCKQPGSIPTSGEPHSADSGLCAGSEPGAADDDPNSASHRHEIRHRPGSLWRTVLLQPDRRPDFPANRHDAVRNGKCGEGKTDRFVQTNHTLCTSWPGSTYADYLGTGPDNLYSEFIFII